MQPCPFRDAKTPWPLQPNEVMELAGVIVTAINHFKQFHSSCENSYLLELRIISHCYYLIQMELGESIFDSSLEFDFEKDPERVNVFALTMADRINAISDKVRLLDYPWFYPHFAAAVKTILSDKLTYLGHDLVQTQLLLSKIISKQKGLSPC